MKIFSYDCDIDSEFQQSLLSLFCFVFFPSISLSPVILVGCVNPLDLIVKKKMDQQ